MKKAQAKVSKRLKLQDLIYEVRNEIRAAQKEHAGETAFLELKNVEIEVRIGTSVTGKGGVDVWVITGGTEATREASHVVKLTFGVAAGPGFRIEELGPYVAEEGDGGFRSITTPPESTGSVGPI